MIETELRRAFRSRGMLVVVLVAVILAAGNLYSSLQMDRHFAEIRKMMLEQHDVTYYPYRLARHGSNPIFAGFYCC